MPEITRLDIEIDQLNDTPARRARAKHNDKLSDDYAEEMRRGKVFEAIRVFLDETGTTRVFWVADGGHRLAAGRKAGLATLPCDLSSGTFAEALAFARLSNTHHGQRRTNEDKHAIAVELVQEEMERRKELWYTPMSDAAIGKQADLSHTYIGNIFRELGLREKPVRARAAPESAPESAPDPQPGQQLIGGGEVPSKPTRAQLVDQVVAACEALQRRKIFEVMHDMGEGPVVCDVSLMLDSASDPVETIETLASQLASLRAALDADDARRNRHWAPKSAIRPVLELLETLRDSGVETVTLDSSSWNVRGLLERMYAGQIYPSELASVSKAAEDAALKLPPPAAVRRAEGKTRGARIGRIKARLKIMEGEGVTTVLGGVPIAYVSGMLPQYSDERLTELEAEIFPAAEVAGAEPGPGSAGAVAVGDPDDVAELLEGMSPAAQASALREAVEEIDKLRAQLEAAQKALAIQLDEREGRTVPRGWPTGWREVHDHLWRAHFEGPEITLGYQNLSVRVLIPPRATRAEALEDIRVMAWAVDRLERLCTPSEPPLLPPSSSTSTTSDTPPSPAPSVAPAPAAAPPEPVTDAAPTAVAPSPAVSPSSATAAIPSDPPGLPPWVARVRSRLGAVPDYELAREVDSTPSVVGRVRRQLKIAAYKEPRATPEASNVSASPVMDADRALAFISKHTRLGPNPRAEMEAMGRTLLCYSLDTLREVYERLTDSPAPAEETHEGMGQLIARTAMKPASDPWARFRRWSGSKDALSAELDALSDEDFAGLYKALTRVSPKKRTAKTTEAVHKTILRGWMLP